MYRFMHGLQESMKCGGEMLNPATRWKVMLLGVGSWDTSKKVNVSLRFRDKSSKPYALGVGAPWEAMAECVCFKGMHGGILVSQA